jgi:hypothetical protein
MVSAIGGYGLGAKLAVTVIRLKPVIRTIARCDRRSKDKHST